MMNQVLEATGICQNGRVDKGRLLLVGVPFVLFVLWRLSSHGVSGADEVLQTIERDIVAEFREALYRKHGFLGKEAPDLVRDAAFPADELEGLAVRFSNVSMSGSLFSWSASDKIGVRFDYDIAKDGVVREREENVYRCTARLSRTQVWKCGAISYYLKYL